MFCDWTETLRVLSDYGVNLENNIILWNLQGPNLDTKQRPYYARHDLHGFDLHINAPSITS